MKVRLDLTPDEAKKAQNLGYRLYPNRGGAGARLYLKSAKEAVEAISRITT